MQPHSQPQIVAIGASNTDGFYGETVAATIFATIVGKSVGIEMPDGRLNFYR